VKIAIVHDWLVTYAGAERLLEQIINIYPEADLFSLVDFLPKEKRFFIKNKTVKTSFIQHLPFAKRKYRNYLPLMPFAIEQFNLSEYDLIISVSHAVAKGVKTHRNQKHICVCCSPIRYVWDLREQYLKETGLNLGVKGFLANWMLDRIKKWDIKTLDRVDEFVAISEYIKKRIKRNYNRDSFVLYPPVSMEKFEVREDKEDFYLIASRMVPYKKMPLIVEAFSKMPDKNLIVIGEGPEFKKAKSRATSNVKILGYQDDETLKKYMQKAKAFVFAAEEDFGIVPVEIQACGTPVIAYSRGGALETVVPNETGIFFNEQTVESLIDSINYFEKNVNKFNPVKIRKNAERFSVQIFRKEFKKFISSKLGY
jgi:glycosyltransferase involved in cell wall biosynthesis